MIYHIPPRRPPSQDREPPFHSNYAQEYINPASTRPKTAVLHLESSISTKNHIRSIFHLEHRSRSRNQQAPSITTININITSRNSPRPASGGTHAAPTRSIDSCSSGEPVSGRWRVICGQQGGDQDGQASRGISGANQVGLYGVRLRAVSCKS